MKLKNVLKYIIVILLLAIFSKEFLLIDEELVLIIAFLLFVTVFYNALNFAVGEALDERIFQVKELFLNAIKLKKANLLINREIITRVLATSEELIDLLVFVRYKLYDIDLQWNRSFQLLLNYVSRLYLNLIIQEELDLLYLNYFKSISYLFGEFPYWIEKSARANHLFINDLGVPYTAVEIHNSINKLLYSNNSVSFLDEQEIELAKGMHIMLNQVHVDETAQVYSVLALYLLNLGE